MPDIFHNFPISASADQVFNGVSTTKGLDSWWTKGSEVTPRLGATYKLDFGPGYSWKAIVTKLEVNREFELQMTDADADWLKTKVGFLLSDKGNNLTEVNFYHAGWPTANEHYKISCYCWAMYLRILKRYLEFGEHVPYEKRLNV